MERHGHLARLSQQATGPRVLSGYANECGVGLGVPCSSAMAGPILTSLKDGDMERIFPSLRSTVQKLHIAITSARQAAEWGMWSVGKVYSRLNHPLPYDPVLRGLRLNNLFRMANYRVRTVGISQIRTTFRGDMEMPVEI
ncbi:hypothetical protein PC128_g6519 [Phytophthora cactorum]|nr:hypothetical protein PC120_g7671 [Phytophthora cactorum]KAG3069600.1 hypothetical protein PC121_g9751 [Phytophthora cactorum]KAG3197810.1 hypothetical protein PC128_g6519 [Phytophthora cactorum]